MCITLAVVCFPAISLRDRAWIDDIRAKYAGLHYAALAPHFTFVFPTSTVSPDALMRHVENIGAESTIYQIAIVIRCCLPVKEVLSPQTHLFLTPDEGLSQIVKLHDRLYTDILAPDLRLDIPYIPHMTLGYSTDAQYCKQVADELNQTNFEIRGKIEALSVLAITESAIDVLATIPLKQ